MEENYGMMDLITHYMKERPIFPAIPQPQPPHDLNYAMVMLGGGGGASGCGISFGSDSTMAMGSTTSGLSGDSGGGGGGGGGGLEMEIGGYGGRWSKEETLVLLEIRSRLDSKFKEANHKGPLWDEVSRIMFVEHGYKRTAKKCSEKFENLYKYYKKIKEGKAGRQDKKHYRFFGQLEALYGETSTSTTKLNLNANPNPNPNPPLVTDNPSEFHHLSYDFQNPNATLPPFMEDDTDYIEKMVNKKRLGKKHWKTMITDFIETKMNTLMEKQDAWMEKMMNTIDEKGKDRILREEQWRRNEVARFEIERNIRLKDRAWMESRDSALMEALHKLTAKESNIDQASCTEYGNDQDQLIHDWGENEITQLIQLRSSMESRFEQGCLEEVLWEEIALTMACLGYNRNALIYKAKWDHINFQLKSKKRKDNHNCVFHHAGEMSNPEIMWNSYGMKIAKGKNH